MLKFKEFITETFLLEGRIDDLKTQNPGLHHEIDQYADADTTPTKKFVPWLVSQHKKGNVTPDHPDLHAVIQNFDRYKNRHGIQDHSSRSFQDVHAAVMPLIGTGATKREVAHEGRLKIHDTGDVQVYHIQNKEASQHFYGGGPEAGPTNTTWCVAARSEKCLFEKQYGKMYTIHAAGDPNSPYAVHPEKNVITTRHNDGEKDINDQLESNPKVARLRTAIHSIWKHYNPETFRLKTASDLSKEEIDNAMDNPDESKYAKYRLDLIRNPHENVLNSILDHPSVSPVQINKLASNKNSRIALKALSHSRSNYETVNIASQHSDPQVAIAAMNHPKADSNVLVKLCSHDDPNIVMSALNHPKADNYVTHRAAANRAGNGRPNQDIIRAALAHSKSDSKTVSNAITHGDRETKLMALKHPMIDTDSLFRLTQQHDPEIAIGALNHSRANKDIVDMAAMHLDKQVAMAALNHSKADNSTTIAAIYNPNPAIGLAALNHPKADKSTFSRAAYGSEMSAQVKIRALQLLGK